MPELAKKLFEAEADLAIADAVNLAVGSDEAVADKLSFAGWNGGAVCFVILSLSPANDRVDNGVFSAKGLEERDLSIAASKIWQDADLAVNLVVRMPAMENFVFNDGGLTSNFLGGDQMIHFFNRTLENGQQAPILTADTEQFGIGKFCIRLVCHPSSSSGVRNGVRIKYHVMLFPGTPAAVTGASQHTASGSWPGIRLGEGEMPMMPRAIKPWGCPILPFIKLGRPIESARDVPKAANLRHAVASIMGRCNAPVAMKNGAALQASWDKLRQAPGEFNARAAPTSWPAPSETAAADSAGE